MSELELYDAAAALAPFGLANLGANCYMNSLLQALVSCTAFTQAVVRHREYLAQTATGRAVYDFVAYWRGAAGVALPAAGGAGASATVLGALGADLAVRAPSVRFGYGQESSSEALVLLLDMMAPAPSGAVAPVLPSGVPSSYDSPITQLFIHRYCCTMHCRRCGGKVSSNSDFAVNFNLFAKEFDTPVSTPVQFAEQLRNSSQEISDYACPVCKVPTSAVRQYQLAMVPEILFCMFNQYMGHTRHYFPLALSLPAKAGGAFDFRLVAQVEHSGTRHAGHYWARVLRKLDAAAGAPAADPSHETVCRISDSSVGRAAFEPSTETYIAVFHIARVRPGAPAASSNSAK